ncbi:glycerophosphodiester phosphodiesterase, partial [Yersinia pestis]
SPAKRDKTQYHAFELRREVKVVEKFTLGKGASRAQLVWNQQAMDCFKKNSNSKILLIGINSAEDYQLAKDLGADYVMTDSPATAKNWR